jgi:hypothetical protein
MELEELILKLFNDIDFGMIKYKKNAESKEKFLFNFFINLDKTTLLKQIISYYRKNEYNINDLKRVLTIIKTFKGNIDITPKEIDLNYIEYKSLKHLFDESSKLLFDKYFIKEIKNEILKTKQYTKKDLDLLKNNNLDYFIEISVHLKLNNPQEIFEKDNHKIIDYINKIPNKYFNLKKLNQPTYIIENINSLTIDDEMLKYFLEECVLTTELLTELRMTIPFEVLFKYSKFKLTTEMLKNIIWSKKDLKFFLKNCERIKIIDDILNSVKLNFPNFYDFLKNDKL